MSPRDRRRSLSVPLRLLGSDPLRWSATAIASDLLGIGGAQDLRIADVEVPLDSDVDVELTLERISGGVTAAGQITSVWCGPCARCWVPITGEVNARISESFATAPREGEQYQLDTEYVNLSPMVREALLLELPAAAVPCPHTDDCPNLPPQLASESEDGGVRVEHSDSDLASERVEPARSDLADPRWAALDVLRSEIPEPAPAPDIGKN